MKKISEYKNEDALDLLVELIDPAMELFGDPHIAKLVRDSKKSVPPAKIVKIAIKNHKKAVMQILAALDGVPLKEYECNVFTLPMKLLEVFNDAELMSFFSSQVEMAEPTPSTPAMESTEERED